MANRRESALGAGRRAAALAVVAALILGACSNDDSSSTTSTTAPPPSSTVPSGGGGGGGGGGGTEPSDGAEIAARSLTLRLSEGNAVAGPGEPVAVVDGTPLDDATVDGIVARLPEWTDGTDLVQPFFWPTQTLPPPRTGVTVDAPFPPAQDLAPPEVPTGPLQVLRYQPVGDVDIAPYISITFDQPMIEIGTLAQLDVTDVPVRITPEIAGTWQWIGTRTLRFDHDSELIDRLPMATEYTVEVPVGTTSLSGGELAETVSWTFTTPSVTVETFGPTGESLPLEPVFVATFDQIVDPAAVLATTVLVAEDQAVELRLATAEEIEADDAARQASEAAGESRWIAFRPVDPLPADAALEITIGPRTPSAEGPLMTSEAAEWSARTYPPLRVRRMECTWDEDCPPGSSIVVTFANPLDLAAFDRGWVTVEPEIAGMTVNAYGDVIEIGGATAARTTYSVTVSADVVDVYGQRLGESVTDDVEFGSASPMLGQFSGPLTTLDPLVAAPILAVRTVNHDSLRVRVFDVRPEDWPAYQRWLNEDFRRENGSDAPDFPELADRQVQIDGEDDRLVETNIDLTDELDAGDGDGHLVVLVELSDPVRSSSDDFWANLPAVTWVQATTIGLDAFTDQDEVIAWATDLRTGATLAGVTVAALGRDLTTTTDADGLATFDLTGSRIEALVATSGDERALLPPSQYGGVWERWERRDESRWYVFDDRAVYRPGETVSIKGWVRRLTMATDAQLALLGDGVSLTYTATDPQGNQLAEGSVDVNALGGFDFTIDLPLEANLGSASVQLQLTGVTDLEAAWYSHSFQIEEFRRPEFEVTARPESPGPFVSALPATVAVDAEYYAGGPLPGAAVDWQVSTSSASYSPPGWEDFVFGEWIPWWFGSASSDGFRGDVEYDCCFPTEPTEVESYSGTTDSTGTHYLQIDFLGADGTLPDLPVTVAAQATIQDVNRQAWASTTSLLVHPAQLYVGLRSESTFVREGQPLDIEAIVTDIDGAVVAGRPLQLAASRHEWTYVDGEWTEVPVDTQTCDVTSAGEPVTCTFETTVGGSYRIVTTVADDAGGVSRTELTRWVSGGDAIPSREVEQEAITVVPDRAEYQPGDVAELLLLAPFASGEGLATVIRGGISSTIRFTVAEHSAILEVPIADRDIPGLDVMIEVVGATPRTADDGTPLPDAPPRPAYATGAISLSVPPTTRTLSVDVAPRDPATAPGADTAIDVTVTASDGSPVVDAELAVVVVDEAVLALSGYSLRDPLATFYAGIWSNVSTAFGRDSIVLVDPDTAAQRTDDGGEAPADTEAPAAEEAPAATVPTVNDESAADGGAAPGSPDSGVPGATPIDVRTDFDALAVFAPEVVTDENGRAIIEVPLPDNLTRYRVMVVAVDGAEHFGTGESNITARLPLMVRPSAPRFLNFGDVFELPVVVQNQTDAPMDVDVVIQTANLTLTGGSGQRVTVPANDRVEVRFPASAAGVGTAQFRVAAVSGESSDAASVKLPVYTPATSEAFATYGVIDDGAVVQPMLAPTDVVPQFGGLEVTTSSTSLQALTDAVIYLSEYPYESSDALASRILAIVALRDVLDAFDAEGLPSVDELEATIARDVERLAALQNGDGGFPFWDLYRRSEPYNSIQATHALVAAQAEGYAVPQDVLERALAYLADIEQFFPPEYTEEVRDTLSSYALHVRGIAGDRDSTKAESLYERRGDELELDAIAWLWPVIDDAAMETEIERLFGNRAVETAGAANFTTSYGDDAYVLLHSDRRTDGIVLDALIAERPDSDLIPKVVAGLLANQTRGRWDNVQENSFILLALKRYFDTYESETPDFVARVWLGEQFAGEHDFVGRSTDRSRVMIPMSELIAAGDSDIVVAKDGTGRLYYRLGLRYAPADLRLDPLDRGFVVERTYEGVDDPADVVLGADGTWTIRPGALVRVRLTMVAESQRTHVALIDPLPAGLEILNTGLAVTPEVLPDTGSTDDGSIEGGSADVPAEYAPWSWWYWTWYDHENSRDDRAEAFSSLLPAGTYEYTYLARATTPGTFVVPPTRAEEMYAPETFGRAATDTVVVGG